MRSPDDVTAFCRPRFADLIHHLGAIRGALGVTADGGISLGWDNNLEGGSGNQNTTVASNWTSFGVVPLAASVETSLSNHVPATTEYSQFRAVPTNTTEYSQFRAVPTNTTEYSQFRAVPTNKAEHGAQGSNAASLKGGARLSRTAQSQPVQLAAGGYIENGYADNALLVAPHSAQQATERNGHPPVSSDGYVEDSCADNAGGAPRVSLPGTATVQDTAVRLPISSGGHAEDGYVHEAINASHGAFPPLGTDETRL